MSGWIKVEKDLANDPRVLRMASRLRHADVTLGSRSRLVVVGALVTLWWYADTHIREDDTLPIGVDQINELVGIDGFCDLMPSEWFQVLDSDSVKLIDYTAHNGTTAKKRAMNQKRQERCRNANADVTPMSRSRHVGSVTRPREDLDQEKSKKRQPGEDGARERALAVPGLDLKAWEEWQAYRAERKPAIKLASLVAAAEELAAFKDQQAIVVKHSIANGYQGLFAPKAGVNGTARKAFTPAPTTTELEALEAARGTQ